MLPLLLLLVTTVSASSLLDFHQSFVDHSTTIDAALVVFRAANNALGFQLNQAGLRSFAGFILEMRRLANDTWQIVEQHDGDSTESCREFIREIFDLFVEISENNMKTCAARWVRVFDADVAVRFWPVANPAQVFSGYGLAQVLGMLAWVDDVLDPSEVEREMEEVLELVGYVWMELRGQLDDEIDKHEQFAESIKQSFEECEEDALWWHELYMGNVVGMFYEYCLWEEE